MSEENIFLGFLKNIFQNWQKKTFCQQIKFYVQADKIEKVLFVEENQMAIYIFLGTKAEKHIKRGKKLMMNEEPWLGTNCRGWYNWTQLLHPISVIFYICDNYQARHSTFLTTRDILFDFVSKSIFSDCRHNFCFIAQFWSIFKWNNLEWLKVLKL